MIESFKEYPWLWLLLVVLLALAVVLFIGAKKSKNRAGDSPEVVLSARDFAALRENFIHLDAEKLDTLHSKELIYAIVVNIEAKLDNSVEFEDLNRERQNVYAMWHFCQAISGKQMCDFFKDFGEPLTGCIVEALIAADEAELASILSDAYNAFDENNESASCDKVTVNELNARFNDEFDRVAYYSSCEKYIRNNMSAFTD